MSIKVISSALLNHFSPPEKSRKEKSLLFILNLMTIG